MLSQRKPATMLVHIPLPFPSHEDPAAVWTPAFSLKE